MSEKVVKMKLLFNFLVVILYFLENGVSSVNTDVSAVEGDSVTLCDDMEINKNDDIKWYFNNTQIAQITGDQSKICTVDQCKERFRDRLKLDHQTGSLTIMNTRNTDAGDYRKENISGSSDSSKIFSVSVDGVSAAERDVSGMEGNSLTLDPGEKKHPNDLMRWYFNETLIAEITGDQSEICSDDECKERFRDRLEVNQTGSLTIMNSRTTDSGEYKLKITSSDRSCSITRVKRFSVSVTSVPDSRHSSAAVAGIVIVVLLVALVAAAAGVFYRRPRSHTEVQQNENDHGNAIPLGEI